MAAPKWIRKGSPEYEAQLARYRQEQSNTENGSGYTAVPSLDWNPAMRYDALGFKGNAFNYDSAADVSGSGSGYTMTPELQAFLEQGGYQPAYTDEQFGKYGRTMYGITDRNGNVIDGTTMSAPADRGSDIRDWIIASGLMATGASLGQTAAGMSGAAEAAGVAGAGAGAAGAGGGAAGADMGAMMAGSADGGALAASGSGLGGTAGTTAGATAGTTGGGLMSGMTYSDWISLGGLVYSAANRPDPVDTGPLERQAERNASIADRQQTLAERQYADQLAIFEQFKPMLMQQIQGSIQDQTKSRERSDQQWADYMSTWRPTERALAEKSLNWATPGRMEQAATEASGQVATQFDLSRTADTEAMIRAGLDPSAITSLQSAGRLVEAKERAGAANNARRTVESQGMAYLDNAARFGRNMPSTGLAAAGLAGTQGQQAQGAYGTLANASAQPAASASPLFGQAVSAGSSAGGLYQNIASLNNASEVQRHNYDMNMLRGLNQWVGGGGADRASNSWNTWTSSKATKHVGARVKNATDAVEKSGSMRWSYKPGLGDGDTKPRMGPMAEDLARVAPEVSDGKRVDGISLLGLHHAAVGEMSKKLKKQEKKIAALERKLTLADA